jgi:hypothetical protein
MNTIGSVINKYNLTSVWYSNTIGNNETNNPNQLNKYINNILKINKKNINLIEYIV